MKTRDFPRENADEYLKVFGRHDAFGALIGHRLLSISKTLCTSEYRARPEHGNPNGILHGGALFSAMDSAQGAFMHFILDAQYPFAATGTATVKFLLPVRDELLKLETRLERVERRKHFLRTEARLEDGRLAAELDEVWIAVRPH